MTNKDKVFELKIDGPGDTGGKIRFENVDNRVFAKIGDNLIDKLSWFRWNSALKFFDKYNEIKIKRNFEGKETPLPPKFLLDILDNGFIEDDEILQEIWIKILINWQDPNKRLDKRPIYLAIIKSLTPTEVKILETIMQLPNMKDYIVGNEVGIKSDFIIATLKISRDDFQLSMLNLYRCGCFESLKIENKNISMGGIYPIKDYGLDAFCLTKLGENMIENIRG